MRLPASPQGGVPIVTAGQAQCQIMLGQGALPVEKGAAEDLAGRLQAMTGVAVPLVDEGQEDADRVWFDDVTFGELPDRPAGHD